MYANYDIICEIIVVVLFQYECQDYIQIRNEYNILTEQRYQLEDPMCSVYGIMCGRRRSDVKTTMDILYYIYREKERIMH